MMAFSRKHIRDVDRVRNSHVLAMGIAAGAGVLMFTALARIWPTNHLDLELLLGSLLTARTDPETRKVGVVVFLLLTGFSAFAYAFIFWSARRSGAWIGAQLGFFHYLISGSLAGLIPAFHPLIPGAMATPGFFMTNAGFMTSVTFFLAHLVYGALFGQLFDWASLRDELRQPISTPGGSIQQFYGTRRY